MQAFSAALWMPPSICHSLKVTCLEARLDCLMNIYEERTLFIFLKQQAGRRVPGECGALASRPEPSGVAVPASSPPLPAPLTGAPLPASRNTELLGFLLLMVFPLEQTLQPGLC